MYAMKHYGLSLNQLPLIIWEFEKSVPKHSGRDNDSVRQISVEDKSGSKNTLDDGLLKKVALEGKNTNDSGRDNNSSIEYLYSGKIKCKEGKRFEFLSIFKWEYRKGWDILISAYWNAFKPTDDVVLRLRTYVPSFEGYEMMY